MPDFELPLFEGGVHELQVVAQGQLERILLGEEAEEAEEALFTDEDFGRERAARKDIGHVIHRHIFQHGFECALGCDGDGSVG